MMNIALIDNHQIFTQALKVNLTNTLSDIEHVESYNSIEAFTTRSGGSSPDIVITELSFNGKYDKGAEQIFAIHPDARVIILTCISDEWIIRAYMKQGAKAFLTKTCLYQELVDAIVQVQKGNLFLSQDIQDVLLAGITSGGPSLGNLSSIERGILEGLSRDESFRAIAKHLNISMIELKYHRKMLMERFSLKHFASLMELAKKPGVLQKGAVHYTARTDAEKKKQGARSRKLVMSEY